MPQIYNTGPTVILPFRRKSYSGFLRSEKIHRPQPDLNPRTADQVANMITMGTPGSTDDVVLSNIVISLFALNNIFAGHFAFAHRHLTFPFKYAYIFLNFSPPLINKSFPRLIPSLSTSMTTLTSRYLRGTSYGYKTYRRRPNGYTTV